MFRNSLIQKYVEAYSKYYIYDSIADGFMQTDVWLDLYSIFKAFSGIVYHRVFFVCNL